MNPQGIWDAWSPTPIPLALMAISSVGYAAGVIRKGRWPIRRTLSWLMAMMLLVAALDSPLAVYSHMHFWVHMTVHLIMIMIAPAMLIWAAPLLLLREVGPGSTQKIMDRITAGRVVRVLVSPWLTVPSYGAIIVLTHLTGFQEDMFHHAWIHDSELVLYLVSGYLLFLPLLGTEVVGTRGMSYPVRFAVLAMCMVPDTLVGITLMMSFSPVAPSYGSVATESNVLADQTLAGAIMWFGGDGLMMLLMVIIAGQWVRSGDTGFGPWLESARRRAVLGDLEDEQGGIDADQAALDAYNERLAELSRPRRSAAPSPRLDGD